MRTFDEGDPKNGAALPENEATAHRRISVTEKHAKSAGFRRGIPEYVRILSLRYHRNPRRRRGEERSKNGYDCWSREGF